MEIESKGRMKVVPVLFENAAGASTVGAVIDTQGFESLTYAVTSGTITTGTFTATLEEAEQNEDGTNSGVYTAVPSELVIGDAISFAETDDDATQTVGIVGKGRYQRLTLVGASTPVAEMSVVAILGNAQTAPTSQ